MTAKALVLDYLKKNGLEPQENEIGLNFSVEGWNFLLMHDQDDPVFFRLTLPGIFDVTDENFAEAIMAANNINWNFKVVKAVVYEYEDEHESGASVWMCFEQVLDATPEVDDIVPRAVHSLLSACDAFMNAMTEED